MWGWGTLPYKNIQNHVTMTTPKSSGAPNSWLQTQMCLGKADFSVMLISFPPRWPLMLVFHTCLISVCTRLEFGQLMWEECVWLEEQSRKGGADSRLSWGRSFSLVVTLKSVTFKVCHWDPPYSLCLLNGIRAWESETLTFTFLTIDSLELIALCEEEEGQKGLRNESKHERKTKRTVFLHLPDVSVAAKRFENFSDSNDICVLLRSQEKLFERRSFLLMDAVT